LILSITPLALEALRDFSASKQLRFRAETHAVAVDVSVRLRNRPVTGLQATDFELRDNGTIQHIQSAVIDTVPLDISIVLDTSGSMSYLAAQLRRNVAEIAGTLKAQDRFRVICFGTDVREVTRWTSHGDEIATGALPYLGHSSVHDAVLLAMVHDVEVGRRHLVTVFSDAADNMSVLTVDQLAEAAAYSDAALQFVVTSRGQGLTPPPSWSGSDIRSLKSVVSSTGGDWYPTLSGSLPEAFKQVLGDYRRRYLLLYTPSPATTGWHQIDVRVPAFPGYSIDARRGYFARDH
jgi:VWFA-related protein